MGKEIRLTASGGHDDKQNRITNVRGKIGDIPELNDIYFSYRRGKEMTAGRPRGEGAEKGRTEP